MARTIAVVILRPLPGEPAWVQNVGSSQFSATQLGNNLPSPHVTAYIPRGLHSYEQQQNGDVRIGVARTWYLYIKCRAPQSEAKRGSLAVLNTLSLFLPSFSSHSPQLITQAGKARCRYEGGLVDSFLTV